jgi:acetyl esterase/lipase
MKYKNLLIFILWLVLIINVEAQSYKEYDIITSWQESVEVYKYNGEYNLKAYIYIPDKISRNEKRPAILFFHGGGWFEGNPDGFRRTCKPFAQKGWIAVSFEYRLSNFKDINPIHCIMDAKSAVRWVRKNADRLNIDPDKIVIAGQSAGGHIALCTGLISDFNDKADDLNISCIPNAIICYSACFDPQRDTWFDKLLPDNIDIKKTSPYFNIRSGIPPVLIFHGKKDELVSYQQAVDFHDKALKFNNNCVLYTFESGVHNLWPSNYEKIRVISEDFLITLGFTIK